MDWSAAQYIRFEDERTRPARDLVGRIPVKRAARTVDLGCGPGNSTAVLIERYPDADTLGIDSSPDMLAAARARLPGVRLEQADIAAWPDSGPFDVILANAALQWLPDHATLFPTLMGKLAPGGSFAVQMPDNLDEPAHRLMREIADHHGWRGKLRSAAAARATRHDADWYFRLLRPHARTIDVWRTIYYHQLAGADAIVAWLRSTGLRPFLAPLDAYEAEEFLERFRAAVAEAYPAMSDGTVLLPFPRLFVIATR